MSTNATSEKPASYYDDLFSKGGFYERHYRDTHYYVQWVQVEMMARKFKGKNILEIGCGTGQMANMFEDLGYKSFRGFDFSEEAVKRARNVASYDFEVGNALDPKMYRHPYDLVICLEVLEHMKDDLSVLKLLKQGTYAIISIPNFDDPGHVRWFRSQYQVRKRYFKHIDIQSIHFVNNIYIIGGWVNDFKPSFLQNFFKTRNDISLSSILERLKHRLVHWFKIKHT